MPKEKDFYKTLGVDKSSTKEEIKKAYKKLAKQYHPDLNKAADAAEKFKEINEAASVLADDEKRSRYDQFGTAEAPQFGGQGGFDFSSFMHEAGDFGFDFDSIFESFFGGGNPFGGSRRRRSHRRGADLRYDMEITLEEAAEGATETISIPHMTRCTECKGTGARSEDDIAECPECEGAGYIRRTARTPFGLFTTQGPCGKCNGQGAYIKAKCASCHGSGKVSKTSTLEIKIPAGAETGTNLRIREAGEAGERGSEPGDLYIVVHVKKHKVFERHGNDIYLEVPVTFVQAALGDTVEVPTLSGKADLKIPEGTQSGTILRMREKGIINMHSQEYGDQLVKVVVETPTKLSKKQKEILKEFEETLNKKSLFDRLF
jgi:molecular chaperone DnaJ